MGENPRAVDIELGRLEQVDPRTIWVHEAHDFTPWLLENADRLSEALGIDLELQAAEHAVGGYSLDLVGRDTTNDAVLIVENQLESTDHSHLGQVLTYAAGTGASTIVWIATSFREEHRQALDWLNENTGDDAHFFGIELQLVKIGGSDPAPLFHVVVQPNDWQKQIRTATQAGAVSGKGALYVQFWSCFAERVHDEHPDWTSNRAGSSRSWFTMKAPIKGCIVGASFPRGDRLRHDLYIKPDGDRSEEIFEYLLNRQEQIEQAYGRPLNWEGPEPTRQACRIAEYKEDCSLADTERWDEYIDWFFDAGTRLRAALDVVALPI